MFIVNTVQLAPDAYKSGLFFSGTKVVNGSIDNFFRIGFNVCEISGFRAQSSQVYNTKRIPGNSSL